MRWSSDKENHQPGILGFLISFICAQYDYSGPSTPSVKSKAAKKFRVPRSHRIIQSSDSEASEGELIHLRGNRDVIELIDSSPERQTSGTGIFRSTPTSGAVAIPGPEIFLPSYIDDDETFVDDGSILIL
jgi:hypothetical protein